MRSCIRLNNRIHHSTLLYNDVALSLHYDAIMDSIERAADRDTEKGLYTRVHGCPCLLFKMALVERSRFCEGVGVLESPCRAKLLYGIEILGAFLLLMW